MRLRGYSILYYLRSIQHSAKFKNYYTNLHPAPAPVGFIMRLRPQLPYMESKTKSELVMLVN
jgi:hypothetical protein